jgi:hypothetical protein
MTYSSSSCGSQASVSGDICSDTQCSDAQWRSQYSSSSTCSRTFAFCVLMQCATSLHPIYTTSPAGHNIVFPLLFPMLTLPPPSTPPPSPSGQGALGDGSPQQCLPPPTHTQTHSHSVSPGFFQYCAVLNHCNNSAAVLSTQGKVRWAMAGRNKAKLEEIQRDLARIDPSITQVRGPSGTAAAAAAGAAAGLVMTQRRGGGGGALLLLLLLLSSVKKSHTSVSLCSTRGSVSQVGYMGVPCSWDHKLPSSGNRGRGPMGLVCCWACALLLLLPACQHPDS